MAHDKPIPRSSYQARATHYISYLRVPLDIHERKLQNKTALGVYEFEPKPGKQFWTYLTSGMSEKGQKTFSEQERFTELLFYSWEQSPWVVELLVSLSEYPFEYDEPFDAGDTLPLAGSIRPNSKLSSLLLLEPFLEHPSFHFMDIVGKKVEILWALPITESERESIISRGSIDFDKLISRDQLPNLLNLNRDTISSWV